MSECLRLGQLRRRRVRFQHPARPPARMSLRRKRISLLRPFSLARMEISLIFARDRRPRSRHQPASLANACAGWISSVRDARGLWNTGDRLHRFDAYIGVDPSRGRCRRSRELVARPRQGWLGRQFRRRRFVGSGGPIHVRPRRHRLSRSQEAIAGFWDKSSYHHSIDFRFDEGIICSSRVKLHRHHRDPTIINRIFTRSRPADSSTRKPLGGRKKTPSAIRAFVDQSVRRD